MRNVLYIFVIACVISGCSNIYIDSYEQEISDSDLEALKKSHPDYFLPYNEFSINIYEVDLDAAGDEVNEDGAQVLAAAELAVAELESRGCIFLGRSKIYGAMQGTTDIVKAAKEIGATAALYTTKYGGKKTGIRAVTNYSTTRGNISGNISGTDYSRNYSGNYSGNYRETTSYTSYVPYEYDTYYQYAAFFINCK